MRPIYEIGDMIRMKLILLFFKTSIKPTFSNSKY